MSQPFSHLLAALADGEAHDEITEATRALVQAIEREAKAQQRKAKGKLVIELAFDCSPAGVVSIDYAVRSKLPDPKRPNTVLWAAGGGALTGENPKQLKLGELKEVTAPQSAHTTRTAPANTETKEA